MVGVACPLLPIKGYQFEINAFQDVLNANKILTFEGHKLRAVPSMSSASWIVTAFHDFAGYDKNTDQRRFRVAVNKIGSLLDKRESLTNSKLKTFLRAQSPDDMPIVGPLKYYPNVYVNCGHGEHGLSVSIGCSKLLSELIQDGKCSLPEE